MVCQIFLSENVILMLMLQTMSILSLNIDYPPGLSIYLSNGNKNLANHELNTMGGIWKHVIGLTPRQNCLWFQIFRKQIEDLKKSKISWNKTVLGKTGRIAQRSLFLWFPIGDGGGVTWGKLVSIIRCYFWLKNIKVWDDIEHFHCDDIILRYFGHLSQCCLNAYPPPPGLPTPTPGSSNVLSFI